jgi:DNA polymerase-3 subunit alpha
MLESTLEPKAIAKLARAKGFPAVGVADRANLFAAMELGAACVAAGVQPVVGVLLPVCRPAAEGPLRPGARQSIDHLVLFAQNEAGWRNMLSLVSDAHVNPAAHEGCVALDRLEAHAEGLICLTGGADGAVTKLLAEGQGDAAAAYFDRLHAAFGDRLFAELARVNDPVCDAAESLLIALADARDVPLVAADPVRFAEPGDHEAHDVMGCVRDGDYLETQGRAVSNPEWWFVDRAAAEARWADLPDALANTEVVAKRCAFAPPKRKPILPRLLPDVAAEDAQLMADSRAGLAARLGGEVPAAYAERLDFELDVIARMGFLGLLS